jgi:hypothetical protein
LRATVTSKWTRKNMTNITEQKKAFWQQRSVLYAIIAALVLIVISLLLFNGRDKTSPEPKIVKEPQHNCTLKPFINEVERGSGAELTMQLQPSIEKSKFRVKSGDLPGGVSAELRLDGNADSEAQELIEGKGEATLKIKVGVGPSATKGSFNVVVVYSEEQEDGDYLDNNCQYNLVIK